MSRTAFLFPGQGAQSVGMGADLVERSSRARELYEVARDVLGYDLAEICFRGPAERLDATEFSQPALYVTSLAALEVLREDTPAAITACEVSAGLSLGEYTALTFAGALDFADGLRLVQARGQAMQAASDQAPSGMVAILGLEIDAIEGLCRSILEERPNSGEVLRIANYLCPGNIVISGSNSACDRAAAAAHGLGAMKAVRLAVAGAFHTELMTPAVGRLAEKIATVEFRAPRIPVISNVLARPCGSPGEIRDLLLRQIVEPVRWEGSMRFLLGQGFDTFHEIGPGKVLRGLMRRIDKTARFA